MRYVFSLLVMLLLATLFMPAVSMCDQTCMEPAIVLMEFNDQHQAMANQTAQVEATPLITFNVQPAERQENVLIAATGMSRFAVQHRLRSLLFDEYNATDLKPNLNGIADQDYESTQRQVKYHRRV